MARGVSTYSRKLLRLTPSIVVGRAVNDQPDLDLLYFEPYIPRGTERVLFEFLRSQLPFYRVEYDISRGGISTHIRSTPLTPPPPQGLRSSSPERRALSWSRLLKYGVCACY